MAKDAKKKPTKKNNINNNKKKSKFESSRLVRIKKLVKLVIVKF